MVKIDDKAVEKFANTVAPLFYLNDWLGCAGRQHGEIIDLVRDITKQNADHLTPGPEPTFVSSGRIRVTHWPMDDGDELYLSVDPSTAIRDGDTFYDLYDERFAE